MAVDDAHRIPEKDDIVPPEEASRCLGVDGRLGPPSPGCFPDPILATRVMPD
jgi:hypothetical protein